MQDPTWKSYAKDTIGYVPPRTPGNEDYVVQVKIAKWLKSGKEPHHIALAWNAGEGAKRCSSGINRFGVPYNSCAYVEKVTSKL